MIPAFDAGFLPLKTFDIAFWRYPMFIGQIEPFVRFADTLEFSQQHGPSKAYDCRLIYVVAGTGVCLTEENEYIMNPGSVVIYQPGTQYTIKPSPKLSLIILDFDYTQAYAAENAVLPPVSLNEFNLKRAHKKISFEDCGILEKFLFQNGMNVLEYRLLEIVNENKAKWVFYKEKSSVLLKSIIIEIARSNQLTGKKSKIINNLMNYIHANYNTYLTNEQIGRKMNYSPEYLNRLMLSYTGMSLHQYILQYRLNTAIHMIMSDQMSITEIALETGFSSLAHFSACFKKHTGKKPTQFKSV